MNRVFPVILLLVVAAGVLVIDPARRAGEMIEPHRLAPDELPQQVGQWVRSKDVDELPRAYPPHNEIWSRTTRYQRAGLDGVETAFVRVVIAQDYRNLLAFEPEYAMRAGGWTSERTQAANGLHATQHARRDGLLKETLRVETAYIAPGVWGPDRSLSEGARPIGPGWPGPGSMVQLLTTAPLAEDTTELRSLIKSVASALSTRLAQDASP